MKKLVVHIGHGKTGSSFLQSTLALNREKLEKSGFFYPEPASFENAKKGMITSGNGRILLETNSFDTSSQVIVFSSESLFRELASRQKYVASLSKSYELEVVLYLRNVIDHMVSQWGQSIKRHGGYKDLNTFLTTNKYDVLNLVSKWITMSREHIFKLTLRNYSKCKENLSSDFFGSVLRVPELAENFIIPNARVNRSLSLPELEIQRVFNAAYGKNTSKFISDFLCNNFPNTDPWNATISEESYEKILANNAAQVAAINSVLDESLHLEIGSKEEWVISESYEPTTLKNDICEELGLSIRLAEKSLDDRSIDNLRDIALRMYDNNPDAIEDALALMKIALTQRPQGRLIKDKVAQWSNVLGSSRNE